MIKVSVVSGFLGAGKTTFIMRAAQDCIARGEKVVVIENEIGEAGIDAALLEDGGLKVYELLNGCICCTMKSDFLATFMEIKDKLKPDRIFIEPSGVFMLDSLFEMLGRDELKGDFALSPIITIVDARHFLKHGEAYSELLGGQVKYADVLILSKTKGMKDVTVEYTVQSLKALNDRADIVMDSLDLDGARLCELLERGRDEERHIPHTGHPHDHGHGTHSHTAFETLLIKPKGAYDRDELNEKLGQLSSGGFGNIIRAKGFVKSHKGFLSVNYVDGDALVTLRLLNVQEALEIIGLGLDREGLEALFV